MSLLKNTMTLNEFEARLLVAYAAQDHALFDRTLAQFKQFCLEEFKRIETTKEFTSVGEH